jgi:hypothetical protein
MERVNLSDRDIELLETVLGEKLPANFFIQVTVTPARPSDATAEATGESFVFRREEGRAFRARLGKIHESPIVDKNMPA